MTSDPPLPLPVSQAPVIREEGERRLGRQGRVFVRNGESRIDAFPPSVKQDVNFDLYLINFRAAVDLLKSAVAASVRG